MLKARSAEGGLRCNSSTRRPAYRQTGLETDTTPCGIAWSKRSYGEWINYIQTVPLGFHPNQLGG